jgi:hypothetical protein
MNRYLLRVARRIWWSGVLVVVAMGGAGLAVAADRPHNPVQRPELILRADGAAQPHIQAIAAQLAQTHADVAALSQAGREVLAQFLAQDQPGLEQAFADGDRSAAEIAADAQTLREMISRADADISRWRLGADTRATLDQFDAAVDSVAALPDRWQALSQAARSNEDAAVVSITDALEAIETAAGDISDILDNLGGAS